MTTQTDAVAKRPLTFIPDRLDAAALADVLDRLELPLPLTVTALAAFGQPYGATGHQIALADLDKALAGLPTSDRFRLKVALAQHGLLPREVDSDAAKLRRSR